MRHNLAFVAGVSLLALLHTSTTTLGDLDCAVITSKLTVKGADSEAAAALGAKIEVKGEGKGSMHFSASRGRPAKASSAVKVRVVAGGEDPTSGDALSIKATVKIEQSYTVVQ